MAETAESLYLKYVNSLGPNLEESRYFRYMYELLQAGENTLHQQRRVDHKVVDEKWLSTIEDSLDSINTIIEKPRRFIATDEEIVPVELAKKITADSVRHLSQNTQFITPSDDGNVHPTRILNVTTRESFDLYENRFIYHLIQRLVTFIDKRTDVIFWSTGDTSSDLLTVESKIDDAYEQIEYKLEMKIKNTQSGAENDSSNMQTFMRIDRVRRLVMSMWSSAFCKTMHGCASVRSPIQRTNLIMKDPDYRKCYQLWQFLESYDDVGYTIVTTETALAYDEEYQFQTYTNLIGSYAIFKSLLEGDPRDLEEVLNQRHRTRKPKFIKKIVEEQVDDPNIEDVEIRRVFVEEVTQAQLDAEARADAAEEEQVRLNEELTEEKHRTARLGKELEDALGALDAAQKKTDEERNARLTAEERAAEAENRQQAAEDAMRDANRRADEADEERRRALGAQEKAESAAAKADEERLAAVEARGAAEKERDSAVAEAAEVRRLAEEAAAAFEAEKLAMLAERAAEAQRAADAARAARQHFEEEKATLLAQMEEERSQAAADAQRAAREKANELNALQERMNAALKYAEAERQAGLERAEAQRQADLANAEAQRQSDLERAETQRQTDLANAAAERRADAERASVEKEALRKENALALQAVEEEKEMLRKESARALQTAEDEKEALRRENEIALQNAEAEKETLRKESALALRAAGEEKRRAEEAHESEKAAIRDAHRTELEMVRDEARSAAEAFAEEKDVLLSKIAEQTTAAENADELRRAAEAENQEFRRTRRSMEARVSDAEKAKAAAEKRQQNAERESSKAREQRLAAQKGQKEALAELRKERDARASVERQLRSAQRRLKRTEENLQHARQAAETENEKENATNETNPD